MRFLSVRTLLWLAIIVSLFGLLGKMISAHFAANVGYKNLIANMVYLSPYSAPEMCSRTKSVSDLSAEKVWFGRALGLQPRNNAALVGYGLTQCLSSEAAEASNTFNRVRPITSQQATFFRGLGLMATGNYTDATSVFSTIPDFHHYATHLTSQYFAAEQYADAVFWGEVLIATKPSRLGALRLEASYEHLLQLDRIADMWRTVVAKTPDSEDVHWWARGELALLEGEYTNAVSAFQHGASVSDEPFWYWERAGLAQEVMGDWANALASFEKAIVAFPRYQSVYLYAANVAQKQGDVALARDYYERGLAAGIDSAELRARLNDLVE